jgi:hypothetical protein
MQYMQLHAQYRSKHKQYSSCKHEHASAAATARCSAPQQANSTVGEQANKCECARTSAVCATPPIPQAAAGRPKPAARCLCTQNFARCAELCVQLHFRQEQSTHTAKSNFLQRILQQIACSRFAATSPCPNPRPPPAAKFAAGRPSPNPRHSLPQIPASANSLQPLPQPAPLQPPPSPLPAATAVQQVRCSPRRARCALVVPAGCLSSSPPPPPPPSPATAIAAAAATAAIAVTAARPRAMLLAVSSPRPGSGPG